MSDSKLSKVVPTAGVVIVLVILLVSSIIFDENYVSSQTAEGISVQRGIVEDLDYEEDKFYTSAVSADYYSMTVNGEKHQLIESDWDSLKVGGRVDFYITKHGLVELVE